MATIKAIEDRSIHQIQSGQVIVELNSVVKELVENSLDAGATSVEVRFKNQGLDAIEVQDNGNGIPPEDFETVALKHHTSKLSSYEDLTSLDTFGFRGEALSSLCALSKLHILTARAQDGASGRKLNFAVSGQLEANIVQAAQKGTTVFVQEIFYNLPVRRKELEKNIKREYGKVISLLYQYACISVGVRFAVSNHNPKGKKVTVVSTQSNTTTKENITNVFGAKTLLALAKLDLHLDMERSRGPTTQGARNWSTQATDRSLQVHVEGHISRPVFGEGRNAPDRQMFFVNSRPCALPQVSKAINEVYKSFNMSQSPFIFANLKMDTGAYDVNVSPDKRTIMLHDQTALLDSLKTALMQLFENTDHTVPQSSLPQRMLPSFKPLSVQPTVFAETALPDEDESMGAEQSDEEAAVAGPSANVPGSPSDLVHTWVGRDSGPRKETMRSERIDSLGKTQPNFPGAPQSNTSRAKTATALEPMDTTDDENCEEDPAPESAIGAVPSIGAATIIDAVHCPDPLSTPYDGLFSQRPPHMPQKMQDIDSYQRTSVRGEPGHEGPSYMRTSSQPVQEYRAVTAEDEDTVTAENEEAVATFTPGSYQSAPGTIQNAFDRMRPKNTAFQAAEITIGDKTITTTIGSTPSYKRRRIHQPNDSQLVAQFGASPLLAHGLRKKFAAPGSQLASDSSGMPLTELGFATRDDGEDSESDLDENRTTATAKCMPIVSPTLDNIATSDPLSQLVPQPVDDDGWDADYIDEKEKRIKEDEQIARLIQEAEIAAAQPSDRNILRASQTLRNSTNRKDVTLQLMYPLATSISIIERQIRCLQAQLQGGIGDTQTGGGDHAIIKGEIDDSEAESRLSLTVAKSDFERMQIVGQFNLGFILAVRPGENPEDEDDLFIIDQHAADEKYNYERLQRTVTLQSQRLVRPKALDLTAVEEEIILNHSEALKANGFEVETNPDVADEEATGPRCRLLTLPMSKEKTFELSDLEELLHLLSEAPAGSAEIPRPKKVQKILAMRACRSSIMVGRTLTLKQMRKVVKHMGEMEKPWNCPHGRPTMRHLAGLTAWNGWREGDTVDEDEAMSGRTADWVQWLGKSE